MHEWFLKKKAEAKDGSLWKKLAFGILAFFVVCFIVLRIIAFVGRRSQLKVLRQISGEKDKALEVAARDSAMLSEQRALEDKSDIAIDNAAKLDHKIKMTEEATKRDLALIRGLKSWSDVDAHVR